MYLTFDWRYVVDRLRIESIGEHPFQTGGNPVPVDQATDSSASSNPETSPAAASLDDVRSVTTTSRHLGGSQFATVDSPILPCTKVNFPEAELPLGDDNFKQVVQQSSTHVNMSWWFLPPFSTCFFAENRTKV